MKKIFDTLKENIIFNGFCENEIVEFIKSDKAKICEYNKSDVIAVQDSICDSIGIILKGKVEIQKLYLDGKVLTIRTLGVGDVFGEAVVFSQRNTYPSTVVSSSDSRVIFISDSLIMDLCSNNKVFLKNFMLMFSQKIFVLNKKVELLSLNSIRQKLASFVLEEITRQNKKIINLNMSKKELAEKLGIPRPSLSRELMKMKSEGILDFDKQKIYILKLETLEEIMCK